MEEGGLLISVNIWSKYINPKSNLFTNFVG